VQRDSGTPLFDQDREWATWNRSSTTSILKKSVTRAKWGRRSDGLPDLFGRGTVGRAVNAGQGQVGDPLSIPGKVKLGLYIFQRSCREAGLDSRIADACEGLVMAGTGSIPRQPLTDLGMASTRIEGQLPGARLAYWSRP